MGKMKRYDTCIQKPCHKHRPNGVTEKIASSHYVAISQVKTLDRVLFESLFDFERFKGMNSIISQERELDYTFRTI